MLDQGLTFRDIILRVAIELGTATMPTAAGEVADIPDDALELDECKRLVNDAIAEMERDYPKWICLRRPVSITLPAAGTDARNVGSSAGRCRVHNNLSLIPQGVWTVRATGSDLRRAGNLTMTTLDEILSLQATNPTTVGDMPRLIGVGPMTSTGDARNVRRGTEIAVWPVPSVDVVISGRARIRVAKLVELDDTAPFGPEHDLCIVRYAIRQRMRRNPDLKLRKWHEDDAAMALSASVALDQELALPTLGESIDGNEAGSGDPFIGEQVMYNGSLL